MGTRFDNIVGNRALTEKLAADIDSGSFSHAYIIEGPRGSGKRLIARSICAALSCKKRGSTDTAVPCLSCDSCRKIMSGSSPDIITVGNEDRSSVGVDAVREIKNSIYIVPNDLDIKVYIIENADLMTVQAQNAFLLSLEEPPPYIIFFLICENSVSLLETVRSRASTLRTQLLDAAEIEKYLISNDRRAAQLMSDAPNEFRTIVQMCDGSIGGALELLDPKARQAVLEAHATAEKIIMSSIKHDKASLLEAISQLGTKRVEICQQLRYLQSAVRDLILLKNSSDVRLCFYTDRERASELAACITARALFKLYDSANDAIEKLETNANVRLTLLSMLQSADLV